MNSLRGMIGYVGTNAAETCYILRFAKERMTEKKATFALANTSSPFVYYV